MQAYEYYNVDTSDGLKVYAKNGDCIIASESVLARYDGTDESFTRAMTVVFPVVTVTYTGAKATVVTVYRFGDSPDISVTASVTYAADVSVDSEIIRIAFGQTLTEIYGKNRKKKILSSPKYWVDKEGFRFGSGSSCAMVYHTPQIASMFVDAENRTVDAVLDSRDSHWFCHTHEGDTSEDQYDDLSDSVRESGDSASYSFQLIAGYDPPVKPRMMLNPDGYLATMVWTEHPDNGIIETHRASMFGNSEIESAEDATGGFAYHGIPITKAVFYYGNERQVGVKTGKGGTINTDFADFLDGIYDIGNEICLHTPSNETDSRAECLEAIQYVKENFDTITWIDHGAAGNREAISSDGLDENAVNYIADYWDTYGTKYFWQYSSQNGVYYELDNLATGGAEDAVTPLYWRHPTRMRDYISWCARGISSSSYSALLTETNINHLVNNWGVTIIHTYSVSTSPSASFCVKNQDDTYSISDFAEARLSQMAGLRDGGSLRLATLRDVVGYWLDLEKVTFQYNTDGSVQIANNTGHTVKGFSIVIDTGTDFDLDIPYESKATNAGTVAWFDLPTTGAVLRNADSRGQRIFHGGEECKIYHGGAQMQIA